MTTQDTHVAPGHPRPVALITGASAGLGELFARKLAERNYDLILVARRAKRLENLAADLKGRYGVDVDCRSVDLADDTQLNALADELRQAGRVDLLVNNAGFGSIPLFAQADLAEQDAMARVHMLAPMHLSHAVLPGMIQRNRGGLIHVSSVASFFQSQTNVMYCSTKAWLRSFSEGLSMELADTGVHSMALCPGFFYSEFHDVLGIDRAAVPKSHWMPAEYVVDEALKAYDAGKSLCIPHWRYKFYVFMSRLLPKWLLYRVANKRHRRNEKFLKEPQRSE